MLLSGIDTSRVGDAKFALDTCPQIIRWSGIRFSGGIRRAIQFTGIPNDPACLDKAGLLIKHAALWVLRDEAGYFNSRRVLGDRFLKEKVTEDVEDTEEFTGENKVRYKYIYYIGYLINFEKDVFIDEENKDQFESILFDLEILRKDDTSDEVIYLSNLFGRLIKILTLPFSKKEFDFGNELFWGEINSLSETLSSDRQLRKMNGNRGSKHFIYLNRTFFGLYTLLYDLKAIVNTTSYQKYLD